MRRSAQIFDEDKFIEAAANMISGNAARIEQGWVPDALNNGATERLIVSRKALEGWFQPFVAPQALTSVMKVASSDQGLTLLGDAFVLAGLATEARVGWRGGEPALILYRDSETS